MKRILTILFMAIAISCYSQSVNFEFNTISTIDKETSVVKSTIHQISNFTITETTVYLRTELSYNKFEIEGTPKLNIIDGIEYATIKCRGYHIEEIIIVKDKPLNGIYLVYEDKLIRYYNTHNINI